jgi:hypothetical protein
VKMISLFSFFTALFFSIFAQADLQVFPTRILLSETERTAQISVRHRGAKTMRYRITTIYYKMNPDGSMEEVKDLTKADHPGMEYFRYSPRQVTLEPNIEQVVRVQLRLPGNVEDGEYRAHLHFEGMDESEDKPTAATTASGAQMMLKARMAVAVPIIVRKGKPDLKISLADLKMTHAPDGQLAYAVQVNREGKTNLYGDFLVYHTAPGSKERKLVSQATGVSSYIAKRTVSYPLTVPKIEGGTLTLEVKESVSDGGKTIASASTEIKAASKN